MAPTGTVIDKKDKKGNWMVRPDGGGRLVVLVGSNLKTEEYGPGQEIKYSVTKPGEFVDFSNRYELATGEEQKETDEKQKERQSPKEETTIELVLLDGFDGDALFLGHFLKPDFAKGLDYHNGEICNMNYVHIPCVWSVSQLQNITKVDVNKIVNVDEKHNPLHVLRAAYDNRNQNRQKLEQMINQYLPKTTNH